MGEIFRELFKMTTVLLVLVLVGAGGYVFIEGWSFLDALYMSIITLTTTGFGEIHPLSAMGRIFTMVLLCTGVGAFTYSVGQVIARISSIDFQERRRRKLMKKIAKISDHTIVCGFGRMGEVICERLWAEGSKFVVLEKREACLQRLKDKGYFHVVGDGSKDESLINAGVERAKVLISAIDNDADALYITIAARSFNPSLNIITRANESKVTSRLYRAGASKVILPFVVSGLKVAESVLHPGAADIFDLTGHGGGGDAVVQMSDLIVEENSHVIGRKIRDLGVAFDGLILLGVRKPSGAFSFKPGGQYVLESQDCLIVLGDRSSVLNMKKEFGFRLAKPMEPAA